MPRCTLASGKHGSLSRHQNSAMGGDRHMTSDDLEPLREQLRQWLTRVDNWKLLPGYEGVTFPGLKDGDRLAEEFVQDVREMVRKPS